MQEKVKSVQLLWEQMSSMLEPQCTWQINIPRQSPPADLLSVLVDDCAGKEAHTEKGHPRLVPEIMDAGKYSVLIRSIAIASTFD